MPAIEIRLLGRPEIVAGAQALQQPRGHKAWAVLAFVLLSERPVARERLASLLFADARDPLGALRWTLAELRRTLHAPDALRGNPLRPGSLATLAVDALALEGAEPDVGVARGELLEGIEAGASGVFDAWLAVERRRLAGVCGGVLHDAALAALAAGRPREGAELASRALAFDPFDESLHELLVRCHARSGDAGAARHQATSCEVLFRRELGRRPGERVRQAAEDAAGATGAMGDRAAAIGQLRAGNSAIDAGAVEPGIACLRSGCAEARALGDPQLLSRALLTLGSALVHAVRGRDEEAAALLHESLALATAEGDHATVAASSRELGYVDLQAGRASAASRWLHRATAAATTGAEQAMILGFRGMALSDRAHYAPAVRLLGESVAVAERAGAPRRAAWSLALLGRSRLLVGDLEDAADTLERSLEIVAAEGWLALQPLPEALRGEVALRQGDAERADAFLDHAFSLGCHIGDPCWEAFAARARGLAHAAAGDTEDAVRWLEDAAERATRVSDGYAWVHAHCLDALAGVLAPVDAPAAGEVVARLERLAAYGDMRELVVRAALHRGRLGDPSGAPTAALLAEDIDNPLLHAELAAYAA